MQCACICETFGAYQAALPVKETEVGIAAELLRNGVP